MMAALITTAKVLILVACITVLPFWLIIDWQVPVLWAIGGCFVLTVFLAAIWTRGRRAD